MTSYEEKKIANNLNIDLEPKKIMLKMILRYCDLNNM